MADAKVVAGSTSYSHVIEVEAAKRVHIYTNGDKFFAGKNFVVNRRRLRDFDSFLNQVTLSLRPAFGAVRTIRTPNTGHRVADLGLLESGKSYVAGGGGKFIKLGYSEIASLSQKPSNTNPSPRDQIVRRKLQVSGKVRKIKLEPIAILVYANGEVLEPARRLLVKPWIEKEWENVLAAIDEKVQLRSGAIRRLFDLNAKHEVKDIKELKSNQQYVAVGTEKFKDLEYGLIETSLSPRQLQKRRYPQLPPLKKKSSTNESSSSSTETHASPEGAQVHPQVEKERGAPKSTKEPPAETAAETGKVSTAAHEADDTASREVVPPPGKKPQPQPKAQPKEGGRAAKAAAPKEEGGIPVKPLKYKRSGQGRNDTEVAAADSSSEQGAKQVDLDKDEGGIYKAKAKGAESVDEVIEDGHTKLEVPVDQLVADEVAEEVQPTVAEEEKPRTESAQVPRQMSRSSPPSGRAAKSREPTKWPNNEEENEIDEVPTSARGMDEPAVETDAPVEDEAVTSEAVEASRVDTPPASEAPEAVRVETPPESEAAEAVRVEMPPANETAESPRVETPPVSETAEPPRAETPPTKYVREEQAAVTIQAAFRGYKSRAEIKKPQKISTAIEEEQNTSSQAETDANKPANKEQKADEQLDTADAAASNEADLN